jgi:hypothetical protein
MTTLYNIPSYRIAAMCNHIHMKLNLKTLSLIILLGTSFYFLGNKNKTTKSLVANIAQPKEQPTILDEKTNSAKLAAPKVYISVPPSQNGLQVGNNWKSR